VGLEHFAFEVDRPDEVDEAYRRCLEMGARIHHPPEDDKDIAGYYAFFVFDPDGIRVEVFSHQR
jgi:catechol 2,3-dioxygenase-like lactoylglutathione lyase family enzyme